MYTLRFPPLEFLLASVQGQTDYVKAVEKWRSDEETDLKKETGWLTVAGLFWLKEGINTYDGALTCQPVAAAQQKEHTPLETLLGDGGHA